jgi:hypothetical protein
MAWPGPGLVDPRYIVRRTFARGLRTKGVCVMVLVYAVQARVAVPGPLGLSLASRRKSPAAHRLDDS